MAMTEIEKKAFKSEDSQGRRFAENGSGEELSLFPKNDPYWIDYHKIINSKSFRRLSDKTQVFPLSDNPLVRNRLIHSLEVSSLSGMMAEMLGLNSNLAMAIGIGHDIGHCPFGHLGERLISEISGQKFRHELFGVVLAERIERHGNGLNLSLETLKGITKHSRGPNGIHIDESLPLEFGVVMLADKIAYLFSDINDCLQTGYLKEENLPNYYKILGENRKQRNANCLKAIKEESIKASILKFENSDEAHYFEEMRKWMYENVYFIMDNEVERCKMKIAMKKVWEKAVNFCKTNSDINPSFLLAVMTDSEIIKVAADKKEINEYNLGFSEIIPYCKNIGYQEEDIILQLDKQHFTK